MSSPSDRKPSGIFPGGLPLAQTVGAILWPSFLVAGIATMVFFANIDPEHLRAATFPSLEIGRRLGYTIGFFMFWGVTALSSFLTLILSAPSHGHPGGIKLPDEE